MATLPGIKFVPARALRGVGWLVIAVAVSGAEPLLSTNQLAGGTNDPVQALLQQQRETIQQAVLEMREQVAASSRQIIDKNTRDSDALSASLNETLSARLDLIERTLSQRQE